MRVLTSLVAAAAAAVSVVVAAAAADQPGWSISVTVAPSVVTQGSIPSTVIPADENLRIFGTVTGPTGDTFGLVKGYEGSTCTGDNFFRSDGGERTLTGGAFIRWLTQESPGSWQAGLYSFQGEVYDKAGQLKARSSCVLLTIEAPAGQAVVVKPLIGRPVAVPRKPVAGGRFTVSFRVTRSDNGAPLTTGTMACDPSVAGKVIRHAEQFESGVARVSLTIPKTAKGKLLKVKVTITLADRRGTRVATFRVS